MKSMKSGNNKKDDQIMSELPTYYTDDVTLTPKQAKVIVAAAALLLIAAMAFAVIDMSSAASNLPSSMATRLF